MAEGAGRLESAGIGDGNGIATIVCSRYGDHRPRAGLQDLAERFAGLALPVIKTGLPAKEHQVEALRLLEDLDESGTESSQRCAASGEHWFDLIGNMDSALAWRVVVLFGLDQRMEQLGSVGNGSVDQFASPFALNVFTCTF
jgi:hypothetical protein